MRPKDTNPNSSRLCVYCHSPIVGGRSNRRYCSQQCRSRRNSDVKTQRVAAMPPDEQQIYRDRRRELQRESARNHDESARGKRLMRWQEDEVFRQSQRERTKRYDPTGEKKRTASKRLYRELRTRVLDAYGKHCQCCGEPTFEFLAIDHIDGGGREHRAFLRQRGIGAGAGFYRWLEVNGFPLGFQVLCHNCNMAKGFYGVCPHQSSLHRTEPES